MKLKYPYEFSILIIIGLFMIECVVPFRRDPGNILQPITYQDFLEAEKRDPYFKTRWTYYKIVVDLVQKIRPESVLELGPYRLPLVKGEDTMDIEKVLEDLTYLHDATIVPWPIADKKYDLFISCEVWEHLGDRQKEAFKEAKRVSRRAIFSFPYKWVYAKGSKSPWAGSHGNIDEAKIAEWTLHNKPRNIIFSDDKKFIIYYFEFDK